MRKLLYSILEILQMVVLAAVVVIPIRYFIFQPFFVQGQSMDPNFENGDYLIVDELSYRFKNPQRGEVVVFKYPKNPSQRYIKRIIGLPGETVEIKNGEVIIDNTVLDESAYLTAGLQTLGDTKVLLDAGEFFVLGDNRLSSSDSRRWGILPRDNIIGRVYLRVLPVAALAKIEAPSY